MLRQDSSSPSPDLNGTQPQLGAIPGGRGVDIQRELDRLEELILDSPRVPLSRRTLVDEEQLLDQLDLVRLNLPAAFQEAEAIVQHKEEIFRQAEQYAQEIIVAAERRAAQIKDELGIVRQAELEARQIRQQVQQECESVQAQTIAEIERAQRQAQQELQEMRRKAMSEAESVQNGADEYADTTLRNVEQQLTEMLRIVRNGRQQLQPESSQRSREHAGNKPVKR